MTQRERETKLFSWDPPTDSFMVANLCERRNFRSPSDYKSDLPK